MRVQTFLLGVELQNGWYYVYPKLSRVAVKRYKEWFEKEWYEANCPVASFTVRENKLKRSNNWLAGT